MHVNHIEIQLIRRLSAACEDVKNHGSYEVFKDKYFWLVKINNAIQAAFWRMMEGFSIKSTQNLTLKTIKTIETNVIIWLFDVFQQP